MNVYLFGFQKKKNSTKQPALNTGTHFSSVQLKEETSFMNPVLLFNPNSTGMPTPFTPAYFNYAYITEFSRYYFIDDWTYKNGVWECSLIEDVLASFKTSIGLMSEYVVRAAGSSDGTISDMMYPTNTNYAVNKGLIDLGLNTTGFYIIGIISNSSAVSEGAISYYIMTAAEMANFKSYLMSETFLTANGLASLTEISKEMVKVVYNPYQYIVSCKFFPFDYPSNTGTAVTAVNFGWWSIPQTARLISGLVMFSKQSQTYAALSHPQANRGSYLNHAPYTEIFMMHPLIGTVLLDANKIDATNTIMVTVTADAISGEGIIDITNTTRGLRLYEGLCNFALDIPLAQINTDVIGVARTAIDSTGNVVNSLLSGNIGGAIAGTANGILNTLEASIPVLQASGVNGNKANYYIAADIYTVFRQVVNEDLTNKGRPLCQVKTISTLSGYIKCSDAHVDLSCMAGEREQIGGFMESGFYYE